MAWNETIGKYGGLDDEIKLPQVGGITVRFSMEALRYSGYEEWRGWYDAAYCAVIEEVEKRLKALRDVVDIYPPGGACATWEIDVEFDTMPKERDILEWQKWIVEIVSAPLYAKRYAGHKNKTPLPRPAGWKQRRYPRKAA